MAERSTGLYSRSTEDLAHDSRMLTNIWMYSQTVNVRSNISIKDVRHAGLILEHGEA